VGRIASIATRSWAVRRQWLCAVVWHPRPCSQL